MTNKIIWNLEVCDFQQGTEAWFTARAWRITGTRLQSVMSRKKPVREELMYTMIYEKIAPLQDQYQSGIMERGHIVESVVKELFVHENIESVWFLRRTDNEYIGISPDGIIFNGDIITRAVEIKAPLGKAFIRYWCEDNIPDEYFWQVVMYFLVIETLESLSFIIHHPLPYDATVRTKIITVTREELQNDIMSAQMAVFDFMADFQKISQTFITNVKKHSITL